MSMSTKTAWHRGQLVVRVESEIQSTLLHVHNSTPLFNTTIQYYCSIPTSGIMGKGHRPVKLKSSSSKAIRSLLAVATPVPGRRQILVRRLNSAAVAAEREAGGRHLALQPPGELTIRVEFISPTHFLLIPFI